MRRRRFGGRRRSFVAALVAMVALITMALGATPSTAAPPSTATAASPATTGQAAAAAPDATTAATSTVCSYGKPDGGYLAATADGQVFTFGIATAHGTLADRPLNAAVVAVAATPDGQGYWQASTDGGVFAFGDAGFFGSHGASPLNQPIVAMATTPDGHGYWLVASDGGIFTYGDAHFYGSAGSIRLNAPIAGMAATPDGHGYSLVASDGGTFAYGDATFQGSFAGGLLGSPLVSVAALAATATPSPASSVDTFPADNLVSDNYYYYAGANEYLSASGASAQICQSAPTPSAVHSLTEIDVESGNGEQIVEFICEQTPDLSQPFLMASWWLNGQWQQADGFVQVSPTIVDYMPLPVGSTASYAIEQANDAWNLYYDGQLMGYFPDSLWNGTFTTVDEVQVFGEVDAGVAAFPVAQMGNGVYGHSPGSATVNGYQTFGDALGAHLYEYYTASPGTPTYFDIGAPTTTSFRYGGPGAP